MKIQLLFVILCVGGGLWQAGGFVGAVDTCAVNEALTALTNYGSKTQFIVDTYNKYNNLRSEFETLESILSTSCDAVEDHRSLFGKMSGVFKVVQLYKPLKAFIQPLQTVLDKIVSNLLGKPVDTFCDGTQNIHQKLEIFDTKVNGTFFKFTEYALQVASTLQNVEQFMSYYENNVKGVCGAPSIDLKFEEICKVSLELDLFIDPIYISFKEFYNIFEKLEKALQLALDGFVDPLMDIFDKLDIVLDPIQDFLDVKFKIPFPGGSKARGVGVIPTCCPSGYSNDAGLCYPKCRSGYETIGLICMKKCKAVGEPLVLFAKRDSKQKAEAPVEEEQEKFLLLLEMMLVLAEVIRSISKLACVTTSAEEINSAIIPLLFLTGAGTSLQNFGPSLIWLEVQTFWTKSMIFLDQVMQSKLLTTLSTKSSVLLSLKLKNCWTLIFLLFLLLILILRFLMLC